MKKSIAFLLMSLLVLSLIACGNFNVSTENSPAPVESNQSEQNASEGTNSPADDAVKNDEPTEDVESTSKDVETENNELLDELPAETENPATESLAETSKTVFDKPYVFEAYDESGVTSEIRHINTDEGSKGNLTVYMVPKGMKNYVEVYQDGVSVNMVHLVEEGSVYSVVGMGCLSGNDTWVAREHLLNAGDRYDITMNEPGMWLYQIYEKTSEKMTYFCFEVLSDGSDKNEPEIGSVTFGQETDYDGEAVYHGPDIYCVYDDGTTEIVITEGDIVYGYLNLEDGTFQISKDNYDDFAGEAVPHRYTVEIATGKVKGSIVSYW